MDDHKSPYESSWCIAAPPNIINHIIPNNAGIIKFITMNSRIVLPLLIIAKNIPFNGA